MKLKNLTKLRSRKTVTGTRLWNRVANFRTGSYRNLFLRQITNPDPITIRME